MICVHISHQGYVQKTQGFTSNTWRWNWYICISPWGLTEGCKGGHGELLEINSEAGRNCRNAINFTCCKVSRRRQGRRWHSFVNPHAGCCCPVPVWFRIGKLMIRGSESEIRRIFGFGSERLMGSFWTILALDHCCCCGGAGGVVLVVLVVLLVVVESR